jgi:hypothetical protein
VEAIRTGRFHWLSHTIALDTVADPAANSAVGAADSADSHGPAHLDAWLTQATQAKVEGEPGFDGSLARITVTGTVSLAGRQELDQIHELTARPNDPIISRVATELVQRLEAGGPQAEIDVIRQAIFMLHGLAHPETSHRRDYSQRPLSTTAQHSETAAPVPA